MAINKKFIHFKTFANFNSQKLSANEQDTQYTLGIDGEIQNGSPTILYNSICYIKDVKKQWTHGQLYNCDDLQFKTINGNEILGEGNIILPVWTAIYTTTDNQSLTLPSSMSTLPHSWNENVGIIQFNTSTILGFYRLTTLKSIHITGCPISIGPGAFSGCTSLASVTIPDSVTSIGNYAFRNCKSLTSVTIPNSVTTIGYDAFRDCTSLTDITIPNSVTTIGDRAFNLSGLRTCILPNTPITIGTSTFYFTHDCHIFCNSATPPVIVSDSFGTTTSLYKCYIYVNYDDLNTYLENETWATQNIRAYSKPWEINNISSSCITNKTSRQTINLSLRSPFWTISEPLINDLTISTPIECEGYNISKEYGVTFSIGDEILPQITFQRSELLPMLWVNGVAPTFELGKTYELSFKVTPSGLLCVCASFSTAE